MKMAITLPWMLPVSGNTKAAAKHNSQLLLELSPTLPKDEAKLNGTDIAVCDGLLMNYTTDYPEKLVDRLLQFGLHLVDKYQS